MDKQAAYELGIELALHDTGIAKQAAANPYYEELVKVLTSPTAKTLGLGALGGAAIGGGLGESPEATLTGALAGAGLAGGGKAARGAAEKLIKRMKRKELLRAINEFRSPRNLHPKVLRELLTGAGVAGGGLAGAGVGNLLAPEEEGA